MPTPSKTLIDLEKKFWQSMVDHDTDTAVAMLSEPALMVSSHGTMKFDHADYRKMADQDSMVLTSFELSDTQVVFPSEDTAIVTYGVKQRMAMRGQSESATQEMFDSSTWIRTDQGWRCVMHTETPADKKGAKPH
ncbi:nuclear transport factor 2 family protein [Variovorax sp. J2P1-59]|uniref:nuclear transport factor 2 family protein n=1 Tax=Variovorax flavidus TaxID=3053501 RepID=UPI0025789EF3|nr:nuclear transport factor 2 family protein [Variovorax sp. J2P1-59]MDM0075454.1 nuclear transport factor 2 family protein [Variovorax sp. J2P1-59]